MYIEVGSAPVIRKKSAGNLPETAGRSVLVLFTCRINRSDLLLVALKAGYPIPDLYVI